MTMAEQLTCDQCDSTFHRREHYLRHLRTHTKEKPFQCSLCGHTFGRIDSLARHHTSTHVDPSTQTVSARPVERQRVARACKRCSTSKIRCDGRLPCEKCSSSESHCYYEEPKKRKSKALSSNDQPVKRPAHENDITSNDPETSNIGGRQEKPTVHTQQTTAAVPLQMSADMQSPEAPNVDQPISIPRTEVDHATVSNEAPYNRTFDIFSTPNILGFQSSFDDLGWTTGNLDPYLWPTPFDLNQEFDMLQNIDSLGTTTKQVSTVATAPTAASRGVPLTLASDIAEIYSCSQSPSMDRDAVEVRQYHATSIEVDAPLHFPDVDPASFLDAETESFAHVEPLSNEKVNAITRLAEEMQREPHHHPFTNLKLPPQPMLNAWVQLYFEHFHPVFPIIHQPTFSLPDVDPLLVLAVAGIGAQFSKVKNAEAFARSIHELVRRRSSSQCEKRNQLARTVWMTQVIVLNILAMSHSGDRRELEIAELLQAVPITLARRKGVLENVLPQDRIAKLQLPLEQAWRLWAVDEERRRIGFAVWLCDFTYRAHFNLTSMMDPRELRNTLPQTEDRWGAGSAQRWAQCPGLGSSSTGTLSDTCLNATWMPAWRQTGTLGKQVIISELMEQVRPPRSFGLHRRTPFAENTPAIEALQSILATLDTQSNETMHDGKASTAHKVMCLAALMTSYAPDTDLTVTALRQIYHRLDDREFSHMAQRWKESPAQGRMTVYYAARLLETLRNNHTTHYAMPVYLLRATLILWLYARLFDTSNMTGTRTSRGPAGSGVADIMNPNNVDVHQWTSAGCSRIRLPGIADLLSPQGRCDLLSEAIATMDSLRCWGISKVYVHLLRRLETSEAIVRQP